MPFVQVVDSDRANLLTKREEDLVRLVADGLSNRDIARKLNLSEHLGWWPHTAASLDSPSRVLRIVFKADPSIRC